MVYEQFQSLMDFDLICNIQRRLVTRTDASFLSKVSLQAWRDAVELHISMIFDIL